VLLQHQQKDKQEQQQQLQLVSQLVPYQQQQDR